MYRLRSYFGKIEDLYGFLITTNKK
jgi:hypothetical protein